MLLNLPAKSNSIILVIKQIGLPLRGRPILLLTRMITNRIGLHSVLLSLLIITMMMMMMMMMMIMMMIV